MSSRNRLFIIIAASPELIYPKDSSSGGFVLRTLPLFVQLGRIGLLAKFGTDLHNNPLCFWDRVTCLSES